MRNAGSEGSLASAAIEYGLIAAVLALPALGVFLGYDRAIDSIYGNVLGNVSGVVDILVR